MIVFYSITTLLTLLVVAWVVHPLLRPVPSVGVASQRHNASICRDQLQALECDLAGGAISAPDLNAAQDELLLRLLEDTQEPAITRPTDTATTAASSAVTFWTARLTAMAIGLLLWVGSGALYGWLGAPDAIDPGTSQKVEAHIADARAKSAAKPEANP